MRPFFTYYGGKWRTAPRYPSPLHQTVVEPFAGSAGYSVRHHTKDVRLFDLDDKVCATWEYLINASPDEIRSLPLYDGTWESVDDMNQPQEVKYLIGWWLNKGASSPCKSPSAWMRGGLRPNQFWGERIRERIASQVDLISHWTIDQRSYETIDIDTATWFIDPPYVSGGQHYRQSNIDYDTLSEWCRAREGQTIVCESEGATWLPFIPFIKSKTNVGGNKDFREVIWAN